MSVKNLIFTRIDDRLIHGQICTTWLNFLNAKNIIVVDDDAYKDKVMHELFRLLIPKDIDVNIYTINDAVKLLNNGFDAPTIMIVSNPSTIQALLNKGSKIDFVNIGCMGMQNGRTKLYSCIYANQQEREYLKFFCDNDMEVEIQILPYDDRVDVSKIL